MVAWKEVVEEVGLGVTGQVFVATSFGLAAWNARLALTAALKSPEKGPYQPEQKEEGWFGKLHEAQTI